MGFSPESSGLSLNGVTASEPTTTPASVLDRVGEVDRLLSLELSESLRADTGSSLAQVVSHWESLVSAGVRTPCGLHDALSQHFEAAVARVAAQASAHERLELLTRVLLGPAATGDLVERVSAIVEPIISKHPNQEASREHEATAAVVASLTRDPTTTGYRLLKVFALEVVRSPFRSLANMGLIPSASSFPN